jgi:pimeloyl-ACP methyl ester carboxylesterase
MTLFRILLIATSGLMFGCSTPKPLANATSIRSGDLQLSRYSVPQDSAPPVEFFISTPTTKRPLVLFIQGSGCRSAFVEGLPGDYASTVFSYTTTARSGEYAVMVVNKPFAPKRPPPGAAVSANCPTEFNAYFSLDSWLAQLRAAYQQARQLPFVDTSKVLVIGSSEGATVASALAAVEPTITHVALLGATGPSQFFDLIASTYGKGSTDQDTLRDLESLESARKRIAANPLSTETFEWGHTNKRWTTFFASSSADNLRRSNAKTYLLGGMADKSVPMLSTEVLYAELLGAGKSVQIKRIPAAGHSLMPPGTDVDKLEGEFRNIINWFCECQRPS